MVFKRTGFIQGREIMSRRDDTLSSHCAVPAGLGRDAMHCVSTLDKSCPFENHCMFFIFHYLSRFKQIKLPVFILFIDFFGSIVRAVIALNDDLTALAVYGRKIV